MAAVAWPLSALFWMVTAVVDLVLSESLDRLPVSRAVAPEFVGTVLSVPSDHAP